MSLCRGRVKRLLLPSCLFVVSARGFSTMLPSHSVPYEPPLWSKERLLNTPKHGRLLLANLPTPLYRIPVSTGNSDSSLLNTLHSLDISFFVKRDDCTGGPELGGNKIRKLEFLLADALAQGCDTVVTIGGEQSNHCRATAAACRMVGLEPHLILRSSRAGSDLGLVGNLLMDRMVGSTIYTCTPGEYGRLGSDEIVSRVCTLLEAKGKRPYAIPVGGSNAVGSWGYLSAVDELLSQLEHCNGDDGSTLSFDHIVFACGSGGTAAGIALGIALAFTGSSTAATPPQVHAIGVCDDPDYFFKYVAGIADAMGLVLPSGTSSAEDFVRKHMIVHQGRGLGYAKSTPEELEFVSSFARQTGIVLDPVYSGKALFKFFKEVVEKDPVAFRSSSIMFWHTGGALGLYENSEDLAPGLESSSPCQRLDMHGSGIGIDLSMPSSEFAE